MASGIFSTRHVDGNLETDPITDSLISESDAAFQHFFRQIEWAKNLLQDKKHSSMKDSYFQNNFSVALFLKFLGSPVVGKRAIWNPLFAFTTFLT